ncbi:MAG: hypothetical protein JOY99_11025 [Sphingomonadaceae bacterium]|nr:hypothetical protein [Sphingomonadaceae bacterium]
MKPPLITIESNSAEVEDNPAVKEAWHIPGDPKLIEVWDAIYWVAYGTFPIDEMGAWNGPRGWYFCSRDELAYDAANREGRVALATEIVESRVLSGNLLLAFVNHGPDHLSTYSLHLDVVDPAIFSGKSGNIEWNGGPTVLLHGVDSEPDDYRSEIEISQFLLFWHEVQQLRPDLATGDTSGATREPISRPARKPAPRGDPGRENSSRSKAGRPRLNHGAPFAGFIARVAKFGAREAAKLSNKELGNWLVEEYRKSGLTAPTVGDADAAARSAVQRWLAATSEEPSI